MTCSGQYGNKTYRLECEEASECDWVRVVTVFIIEVQCFTLFWRALSLRHPSKSRCWSRNRPAPWGRLDNVPLVAQFILQTKTSFNWWKVAIDCSQVSLVFPFLNVFLYLQLSNSKITPSISFNVSFVGANQGAIRVHKRKWMQQDVCVVLAVI